MRYVYQGLLWTGLAVALLFGYGYLNSILALHEWYSMPITVTTGSGVFASLLRAMFCFIEEGAG